MKKKKIIPKKKNKKIKNFYFILLFLSLLHQIKMNCLSSLSMFFSHLYNSEKSMT
jgi:hypothetical protein